MDIHFDHIFQVMNAHGLRYILIGGMNFYLRHKPYATIDLDLWIEDTDENLQACEQALAVLGAEWGHTDADWGPTRNKSPGWLRFQDVYSLYTPHGSIDIFRTVKGLGDWQTSYSKSFEATTALGVPYRGLGDEDMLQCQLALDLAEQKADRIKVLKERIQKDVP